ncbi:MAG: SH3 domain-containing protein [Chloroflexota bacterium]|nr:SH3 domain-containing protein [Chloroflexota bacterium]
MRSPHLTMRAGPARARFGAVALIGLTAALPAASALAAPPMQQELAALPAISRDYCVDAEELTFLSIINDYRGQNGLVPLQLSQTLGAAAATHSDHMAQTSFFAHALSDGTSVVQNIRNHGYRGETYGENIAAGTESADAAFSTFQTSAPHNQNMLQGSYESIGIARAFDAASGYGWYWTTIFGGDLDLAAEICGEPSNQSLASAAGNAAAADDLNLRSGPGQDFTVVTEVPEGSALNVTGIAEDGYLPVTFSGFTGWVAEDFVLLELTATQPAAAPNVASALDLLNLRSGPGHQFDVLTEIPEGSALGVNGVPEAGYLPVSFNGFTGWVADQFVLREPSSPRTAAATAATTTQALNLRAGPTVSDPILLTIPAGDDVALTGATDSGFIGVTYEGAQGWADAAYLAIAEAGPASPSGELAGFATERTDPAQPDQVIATANLNLRTGAGLGTAILTVVPRGSLMQLTSDPVTDGYVGVSYNGTTGWVDADFLG